MISFVDKNNNILCEISEDGLHKGELRATRDLLSEEHNIPLEEIDIIL